MSITRFNEASRTFFIEFTCRESPKECYHGNGALTISPVSEETCYKVTKELYFLKSLSVCNGMCVCVYVCVVYIIGTPHH